MGITAAAILRDRKRRETRARIAATAGCLFAEQGFAEVTVAQIGAAAGVSTKTVFKYFPVKESLFFAGAPPVDDRLLRVVRQRPVGESPYETIRLHIVYGGDDPAGLTWAVLERAPEETVYDAIRRFRSHGEPAAGVAAADRARVYLDSDQLRGYARAQFAGQEEVLADLLATDAGATFGDPVPGVVAAALIAPLRWSFHQAQELLAAGHSPAEVTQRRERDLAGAYELLAPALAGYARKS